MKVVQLFPIIILFLSISCGSKKSDPAPVITNHPPNTGDYIGTWEDLGPPGPAKFAMSLRIADDYTGQMFYANGTFTPFRKGTEDAKIRIVIDGTTITSFVLDQFIEGYNGGCAHKGTLTGNIENGNELIFDQFEWADCDGTRDVLLRFKKKS